MWSQRKSVVCHSHVYCDHKIDFSPEEVCYIIEHYFRGNSFNMVRECFSERFGNTRILHNTVIKHVVDGFRNAHCVGRKKESGTRVSVRKPEKKTKIKNFISANRRLSVCKLSRCTGMSTTSVHRTLHDLKLYAYRLMVRQELKLGDYAKRLTYCHWFNTFVHDGMHKMDHVFFSDETWVHLIGYVNSQNYRKSIRICWIRPPPAKDRNLVCDFTNLSGRPILFQRNSEPGGLSEYYSPIYRFPNCRRVVLFSTRWSARIYCLWDDGIPTGIFWWSPHLLASSKPWFDAFRLFPLGIHKE